MWLVSVYLLRLFLLGTLRHSDDYRVRSALVAFSVLADHGDAVNTAIAGTGPFGAKSHSEVASDYPIRLGIAITDAIHRLVAGHRCDVTPFHVAVVGGFGADRNGHKPVPLLGVKHVRRDVEAGDN